jgi:hypothetical protein
VFRRAFIIRAIATAFIAPFVTLRRAIPAAAAPVATNDVTYLAYGRVFPDPHGGSRGLPGRSPFAKGNVPATTFLQYDETIAGLQYLQTKFPEFMQLVEVPGLSAGVPTPTLTREKAKLYAVRVTDLRVGGAKKKFAFSLSIHGIERAGAEGGIRAIEDLVTWAKNEPGRGLLQETLGAGTSAINVGDALRQSEIWFYFPNPDGWRRGDVQPNGGLMFMRYNGNGVDPNRDWITKGYTFRGYTPESEPEVKAFASFLKGLGRGFLGTGDLHGMLNATAFTYTMLPAAELDYARNQAVVAVSRRIQQDSVPRLSWFAGIQSGNGSGVIPDVAQQWGTVWDTIAYTVTGGLGDWMGSPLGMDAYVAIDNEMWVSHIAPNTAFDQDLEQAHIDGNKGLIYAQIEGAFRSSNRVIPIDGSKIAYVDHGRRFRHTGSSSSTNPYSGLPTQQDITADVIAPAADGGDPTYEFDVLGPEQRVYNGGFKVTVTYTNAQGVSPADLIPTGVIVERWLKDDEGDPRWEHVNSHWNQQQLYAAAGMTVDVNSGIPGRYRVRFQSAPPGVQRVRIHFTGDLAWPDPGQLPYDVTSIKFFDDLRAYLPATSSVNRITPDEILAGADLSSFDSVIVVNDPLPGWYDTIPTNGPGQPSQSFTVLAPVPTAGVVTAVDATFEFDVLPEYDNRSMTVSITWPAPSDYDLFVERRTESGSWGAVSSSTNGINTGESTTVSRPSPGHYRARVNNWAGAPQPIDGTIAFNASEGAQPVVYPITRVKADADAYYERLRAYATSGGNLVLTDGAARALAHLGVGAPDDVRAAVVYAPYIEFNDGSAPTYGDPLSANIDQPGAAEGPSNRHQTVEPVPLGYAIQDANGDDASTSFTWTVQRAAWTAAGGRVAGMVAGGVALGELVLGSGRVRLAGALLPDPEERYDHPFGLTNYALTYTGWQLFENLVQWRRPVPDLAIAQSDVTYSSQKVVGGDQVTITAAVRNIGTGSAGDVAVRFTDNGTPIGTDQIIASIAPGASGTASVVWNTKGLKGDRTIVVSVDPANAIHESDETNNSVTGTTTVKGNKVQNGDFQESSSGTSPDHWSSSGSTSYPPSSDGNRSANAGPGGSWTSDAIAVTPGAAYGLAVDVTGGGSVQIEQLSALGEVVATLIGVTSLTALADVTQVRVKLVGGLVGTTTFDNARMWDA